MASSNNALSVDNTFRKKFDREEYLERAREREKQESEGRFKSKSKAPPVQRKPLKQRDYEVDLESRLGKTQVVTPVAPLSQQVPSLTVVSMHCMSCAVLGTLEFYNQLCSKAIFKIYCCPKRKTDTKLQFFNF